MKPRAWLCWSSGKDSAWALHETRRQGDVEVVGLLTVVTDVYERVSMHGVREEVLRAQAASIGLPLVRVPIPAPCPDGAYEEAMRRALRQATDEQITHMIFGDLFLEDVRNYRVTQLEGTGITPLFPLWQKPTDALAREMIAAGVVAHLTSVDPRKMPRELAGHAFDLQLLEQLPAEADPCAENGEFHTCVSAGPMFNRPIDVEIGEVVEREGFVFADLMLANGRR